MQMLHCFDVVVGWATGR